jgi:hypothetical protein
LHLLFGEEEAKSGMFPENPQLPQLIENKKDISSGIYS